MSDKAIVTTLQHLSCLPSVRATVEYPRAPIPQAKTRGGAARFLSRRLMLLVDHTDAEREFAYRVSPMGRLEKALEEAHQRGWLVVEMQADWRRVFAFEP